MKNFIKFAVVSAALLLPTIGTAQGSANCAPTPVVEQRLTEAYGETPFSSGINSQGNVIEMWVNKETNSWTATVTHESGVTCILSHGINFTVVNQ